VPETASRLRARIEQVLAAAAVEGLRSRENPASWRNHLALVYPRRQTLSRKHHPAMAYAELPNFVAKLRATDTVAARTLTLIILCALRLDEVRSAPWGEFDLPSAIWTIPAERMKGGVVHRVPLTTMTLEIIGPQGQGYVFPGRNPRRPISEGAIRAYIPSGATIHGMRSAFSDWAHDQGFVYEVVEAALAHKTGTAVSRAYRRGDALELRRGLMEAWANFLL
jgi:integrase